MKIQIILPMIGLVFLLLSGYHLVAARRTIRLGEHTDRIVCQVRRRIAVIFLLVGIGLLGFSWLAP